MIFQWLWVVVILEIAVFILGNIMIMAGISGYKRDRERGKPEVSPREFWLLGRGRLILLGIYIVLLVLILSSVRWLRLFLSGIP